MILSMAQTNPVMFGMVAGTPAVSQQLERMGRLKELLETNQEELQKKQQDDWIHWASQYRSENSDSVCLLRCCFQTNSLYLYLRRRLARETDGSTDLSLIKQERINVMTSSNPRVILRNYIAQNAILAAEKGDFTEVSSLFSLQFNFVLQDVLNFSVSH